MVWTWNGKYRTKKRKHFCCILNFKIWLFLSEPHISKCIFRSHFWREKCSFYVSNLPFQVTIYIFEFVKFCQILQTLIHNTITIYFSNICFFLSFLSNNVFVAANKPNAKRTILIYFVRSRILSHKQSRKILYSVGFTKPALKFCA